MSEMSERPILFSGSMVTAILEGRKTMTRRVVKPQPELYQSYGTTCVRWKDRIATPLVIAPDCMKRMSPYGIPGDRLWVRETWGRHEVGEDTFIVYRADSGSDGDGAPWRPSIFMPRDACRIILEITGVRVERLQDITDEDIIAEGAFDRQWTRVDNNVQKCWIELWNSINGKSYPWNSNPWVWVISFERVR